MSPSAWFFETWSTKDGIAFASRRPTDLHGRPGRIPLATVALAPPRWEAISVGLPTARRAERGPFQPGLFDGNGPIGFARLADLIALVRQAYIGAGGGPPPGEGNEPPRPPQDPGDMGLSPNGHRDWEGLRPKLIYANPSSTPGVATDLIKQLRDDLSRIFHYIAVEAVGPTPGSQDAADWVRVLARMGLRPVTILRNVWRASEAYVSELAEVPSVADGLLFRIINPIPGPWPPGTLGDFLAKQMASRHHLEVLSLEGFALILFAAAALVAGTGFVHGGPPSADSLAALQLTALLWLFRERPTIEPNSPAEAVLEAHFASPRP